MQDVTNRENLGQCVCTIYSICKPKTVLKSKDYVTLEDIVCIMHMYVYKAYIFIIFKIHLNTELIWPLRFLQRNNEQFSNQNFQCHTFSFFLH